MNDSYFRTQPYKEVADSGNPSFENLDRIQPHSINNTETLNNHKSENDLDEKASSINPEPLLVDQVTTPETISTHISINGDDPVKHALSNTSKDVGKEMDSNGSLSPDSETHPNELLDQEVISTTEIVKVTDKLSNENIITHRNTSWSSNPDEVISITTKLPDLHVSTQTNGIRINSTINLSDPTTKNPNPFQTTTLTNLTSGISGMAPPMKSITNETMSGFIPVETSTTTNNSSLSGPIANRTTIKGNSTTSKLKQNSGNAFYGLQNQMVMTCILTIYLVDRLAL